MKQLNFPFFDQKGFDMPKNASGLESIIETMIERVEADRVLVTVLLARGLKITLGRSDGSWMMQLSRKNDYPSMYEFDVVRKLMPFRVGEISRTTDIYGNKYIMAYEVKDEQCKQNQSPCFVR